MSWLDRLAFALEVFSKTSFWEGHVFKLGPRDAGPPFSRESACILVERENGSLATDPRAIEFVVNGFVAMAEMLDAEIFMRPKSPVIWVVRKAET